MAQKVTIMTLAKAAGVSHTTVSRALNNSPLVQESTKERIKALADELGYHPNINAKALVERKSYIIEAYFSDLDNGTTPGFMFNAINQARESMPAEYSVAVSSFASMKPDSPSLVAPRCDGAIVISQSAHDDPYIKSIAKTGLPIVVVNREVNSPQIGNVVTNDEEGMAQAVEYAIKQGHRQFGIINGRRSFESSQKRRQGVITTLEAHHLNLLPGCDQQGQYTIESGYQAMKKILQALKQPTCVVAANDVMAIGAIRACHDAGLSVPGDISFIGFDDTAAASYSIPRLTTVHKPTREIIEAGMQLLMQELSQTEPTKKHRQIIRPKLVIRDSVKNIR